MMPIKPRVGGRVLLVTLLGFMGGSACADDSVFGSQTGGEAALMGMLYDLKQTQQHVPSNVDADQYGKVIDEFIAKGYDESVLNRFYRCTQPLYATHVFIPMMSADEAPKAYGVENTVKPSRWVIHYKGVVVPPADGTYRFVGYADDLIVAAVNRVTVLNGSRQDTIHLMPDVLKSNNYGSGAPSANGRLTYGEWFEAKTDEPVDLDVLIGERPGGQFCAFLLVQKQGETYQTYGDRQYPLLPIFQLAPFQAYFADSVAPRTMNNPPLWRCLQ